MTCGDHPKLRAAVSAMQNLLLVGVCIIMIAGASTLIHQLLPIPAWLGGLIFTVIVAAVALLGMQGLVAVFSLLVPVTTVMAVLLAAWVLIKNGFSFAPANGSVSALMPNWIIGFVTYAAYNLFGTISILVPTAKLMDGKKTVRRGLSMGSVLLIVLAWSMIAAISVLPSSGQNELPMSALASGLHRGVQFIDGLWHVRCVPFVHMRRCQPNRAAFCRHKQTRKAFHYRAAACVLRAQSAWFRQSYRHNLSCFRLCKHTVPHLPCAQLP